MKRVWCKKGFSIMEHLVLIMILTSALYVSKDYILRGFSGKWKGVGDQFGQGRQFSPTDTVECSFDSAYTNEWYDVTCVEGSNCGPGNKTCERKAIIACQATDQFCKKN